MAMPDVPKTALVTGCSTGIGLATATLLKERGWTVIPTARKDFDIEMLRREGFAPLRLDVADPASVEKAVAETLRVTGGTLGALVNNAGFGQPGAIEDLTRDAMRYQFEVNVFGLQDLTNRLLPLFIKQGRGRVVNVSSVLGRISIPFMGIYCASKHAVEAMSDAMRVELRGTGVWVAIVEPGPIETSFRSNAVERGRTQMGRIDSRFAARYRRQAEGDDPEKKATRGFTLPPSAVARKIVHALESPRPRRRYPVTLVAHMGEFMRRFMPAAWMDAGMSSRLR